MNLNLSTNDLCGVEPWLLARAVNRLEVAYLHNTNLHKDQVAAILRHSLCNNQCTKQSGQSQSL